MNLISGKLFDQHQSKEQLSKLYELMIGTKQQGDLDIDRVILACDKLSKMLTEELYLPILKSLGLPEYKAKRELRTAKQMLSRQYLEHRLDVELGNKRDVQFTPLDRNFTVTHSLKPLGVLFHIVAGNVDALPVFSVIEGLLTGNINILKLPGSDNGLSVSILQKLIEIEPLISDYIYVFDYPSEDAYSIKKMADVTDAIIIWGGDDAVSSVRKLASPNTRIIEWGHKISFAYVSGDVTDEQLAGIAYNICDTNQLYCSSCQGIYLDTHDFNEVSAFAEKFSRILDNTAKVMPSQSNIFLQAQKTIEAYTEQLESIRIKKQVFKTDTCCVIAYDDRTLTPSYMFHSCWVKPLPKENILSELLKYKNHLQTAALVCEPNLRPELESLLSKTGIVRISNGKNMSLGYCGMPHDGEFSLLRYMKVVSIENS